MANPLIRCPCCGRLGQPAGIAHAGKHVLGQRRVLRGLGYGRGFQWGDPEPLSADLVAVLREALQRATAQLDQYERSILNGKIKAKVVWQKAESVEPVKAQRIVWAAEGKRVRPGAVRWS